jgi:large subunit ribosomal protein L13
VKTYSPKPAELTREWLVIDAEGLILGRVATVAASMLRGKHRTFFAPHVDTGDYIIIVNADKVVVTANKAARTSTTTTPVIPAVCARPPGRP